MATFFLHPHICIVTYIIINGSREARSRHWLLSDSLNDNGTRRKSIISKVYFKGMSWLEDWRNALLHFYSNLDWTLMLSILIFSDIIWNLTELQMSRTIIKGKYLLIINRQGLCTSVGKKNCRTWSICNFSSLVERRIILTFKRKLQLWSSASIKLVQK